MIDLVIREFGYSFAARSFGVSRFKLRDISTSKPFKNFGKPRKYYAHDIANMMELRAMGFTNEQIGKCYNSTGLQIKKTLSKARKDGIQSYPKKININ